MIAFIGAAGLIEIPDLLFRDAIVVACIAILMIIYGILQMLGLSLFFQNKIVIRLKINYIIINVEFIKVFAKDNDDNDDDSSLMSEIESHDGITAEDPIPAQV